MTLQGSSNLPVAPRKTPWNPRAAKERILEHCKGNVASLSRCFLWRHPNLDARDPDAYSMCYTDVIDGRPHIVPKGIAACAGTRGIGSFAASIEDAEMVRARIVSIYQRVKTRYDDWPDSPFGPLTADASGRPIEGPIALEGVETGDGRFIKKGALRWEDGPWPLVFDREEMDHSGATVGTINAIERREDGIIWGSGNLSDSEDPETALLVLRAAELFNEGAVGVSISLDHQEDNGKDLFDDPEQRLEVSAGRIRTVAIVDTAALSPAKMSLVAALKPVDPAWFADPSFGDASDERLVMQEPDRAEEERQLGAPLQVEGRRIFGHAALWGRCHVGYPGTCVRPPKEHAAYRNFLTGSRLPGVATGPVVMKTTHASLKAGAEDAEAHYANTGYAIADVAVGADSYGLWVAGALREDATEADIDCLRGSALSGDWRVIGGQMRLVGLLVVSAPGFRVARALAASGAMITSGPGCSRCGDEVSIEERLVAVESRLEELSA